MTGAIWRRSSAWLLASAAGRVRRTRAEWADAMVAEARVCASESDRLAWAWGCWVASLKMSFSFDAITYLSALLAGLVLTTRYEWSVDEGAATIVVIGLIALALGAVQPRRALLSGALVGLVVTFVLCFEAFSGIQPAYEVHVQTFGHSLTWLILLLPALSSAAVGARIGRRLRPV